jgi:aldehyde:ferredoxin oxidoreductase
MVEESGYAARILRVDLTGRKITDELLGGMALKSYIGGVGVGAYYLYNEVPPQIEWSDPENRLILCGGPINRIRAPGSGAFNVTTKGALTNGAASSQANGYFAAYLSSCGYDGIVIQGKSAVPVYLYINEERAELRDANHLKLKNTWETETLIKDELRKAKKAMSVFSIGPAGENLVRFACLVGDEGHVAAHNGVGAVMGSKNLKAIAVARSHNRVPLSNEMLGGLIRQLRNVFKTTKTFKFGTSETYTATSKDGRLAIRNLTATEFPFSDKFTDGYQRSHFEIRLKPCFACPAQHCHSMKVTEGPYAGFEGEEPDYESWAGWSSLIWQQDPGAAVVLANEVDGLGMDTNESSWIIAWLMECFEKGLITEHDLGEKMQWGDAEAAREMLRKIAFRRGFGDILAEGIMRAAKKISGEATRLGVYCLKGNTLRTHDFRAKWFELFDTCVSNTGTLETHDAFLRGKPPLGLPSSYDRFSPEEVSTFVAKTKGLMELLDSMVICRFAAANQFELLCDILSEITGWNLTLKAAADSGKRTVNLLKVFNLRCGMTAEQDYPSEKVLIAPVDGVAKDKTIKPFWDYMRQNYYEKMGWDRMTGKPLPETLTELGLKHVIPDIWI